MTAREAAGGPLTAVVRAGSRLRLQRCHLGTLRDALIAISYSKKALYNLGLAHNATSSLQYAKGWPKKATVLP